MIDLVESFNNAFRLQQEGRLVEAETLYRAVLDVAPEHPGSHHLLGLVEHQLGRHDAALQIDQARDRAQRQRAELSQQSRHGLSHRSASSTKRSPAIATRSG